MLSQVVRMMDSLVKAGYMSAWGVSNWSLPRVRMALAYARKANITPPVADSPQMSLARPTRPVWPNTSFMTPELREEWQVATEGSMVVLAWETLAKGFMVGRCCPMALRHSERCVEMGLVVAPTPVERSEI